MGHTYSSYLKLARLERELNRVHEVSFIRSTITLGEPEIYGSVSIEDILNELRQNHKINVEKDTCTWDKVKKVGIYSFKINLGNLGTYSLKVNVKPEQLPPMPEVGGPEVNAQL
jgi:ribosomal protein L9